MVWIKNRYFTLSTKTKNLNKIYDAKIQCK